MPGPDDDQLTELIGREARGLVGFALMLTGDRDLADEIFQETCLEAWRHRARFETGRDLGAWLRGLARNVVLRQRRTRGRDRTTPFSPEVMETLAVTWTDASADAGVTARQRALRSCLDELAERQRDVLRLHYEERRSHDEIADHLASGRDAVKMMLHRLRRRLHACAERRVRREEVDAG